MDNFILNTFMTFFWMFILVTAVRDYPRAAHYRRLLALFFAGGIAGGFIAVFFYELPTTMLWERLVAKDEFSYYFLVVGLVEESAKLIAFFILIAWKKPVDAPLLPVLMAMALGFGFASSENILSYGWINFETMAYRTSTMWGHGSRVALSAVAFALMRYPSVLGRKETPTWAYPLAFVLAAFGHGLYNTMCGVSTELATLVKVVEGTGTLIFASWFAKASPFHAWARSDRQKAITLLQESLRAQPGNTRTRVRLALYLLAGKSPTDAAIALRVLSRLPARKQKDQSIAVLAGLARWAKSPIPDRDRPAMDLMALLMDSTRYKEALARDFGRHLGTRHWIRDRDNRGRPLALRNKPGSLSGRPELLDKVANDILGDLLRRSGVPLAPKLIQRPAYGQFREKEVPAALRTADYRKRIDLALLARNARLGRILQ